MQIYGILRNRTALGLGLKENPNWKPPQTIRPCLWQIPEWTSENPDSELIKTGIETMQGFYVRD